MLGPVSEELTPGAHWKGTKTEGSVNKENKVEKISTFCSRDKKFKRVIKKKK